MPKPTFPRLFAALATTTLSLLLCACNPTYNWREVRNADAAFVVLMPDKPVSMTRPVNLGNGPVSMTMTAAEVDGVMFAVGSAALADAGQTPAALAAMKTAMIGNIGGKIKSERAAEQTAAIDIEALGARAGAGDNTPVLLLAHFAAKGKRVYQVVVLGNEKAVDREQANTFLSSFKPN